MVTRAGPGTPGRMDPLASSDSIHANDSLKESKLMQDLEYLVIIRVENIRWIVGEMEFNYVLIVWLNKLKLILFFIA